MSTQSIKFVSRHGTYSCTPDVFDAVIAKHLPASPVMLRAVIGETTEVDFSDVVSVGALLIILGEFEQSTRTWERTSKSEYYFHSEKGSSIDNCADLGIA